MPKKRTDEVPSPEQLAAERAGREALHEYFQTRIGRQKATAETTGIEASILSRMARGHMPISLEYSIVLEVASKGALRAEVLCPSRADVLNRFMNGRRENAEV
jgi:DNA-binding transcriptional regulator YdaS (Cro superfamily)